MCEVMLSFRFFTEACALSVSTMQRCSPDPPVTGKALADRKPFFQRTVTGFGHGGGVRLEPSWAASSADSPGGSQHQSSGNLHDRQE